MKTHTVKIRKRKMKRFHCLWNHVSKDKYIWTSDLLAASGWAIVTDRAGVVLRINTARVYGFNVKEVKGRNKLKPL